MWKRAESSMAILGCITLVALSCERSLGPRRSRVAELRQLAAAGVGSFTGRVRALDPSQPCWRSPTGLAGIRVEVGLWDGNPAFYRDTVTKEVPATLEEPRFEVIAYAVTDSDGRFRFDGLPRRVPFAFRAIPPSGSAWRLAYGVSLFGIPTEGDHPEFSDSLPSRPLRTWAAPA